MKIEVGKCYETRDGRKAGPMNPVGPVRRHREPLYRGILDDNEEDRGTWFEQGNFFEDRESPLDLIREWNSGPKLWGDMSDEEKGALLLANHRGEEIEASPAVGSNSGPTSWRTVECPSWEDAFYYRVKPKREPVTVDADLFDAMREFITEIAMYAKTSEHARDEMFLLSVESLRPERDGYIDEARKIVLRMPKIDRTTEKTS